ncbi:MAG: hypothetical protein R3C44_21120 [Chloroflexota bacterium]
MLFCTPARWKSAVVGLVAAGVAILVTRQTGVLIVLFTLAPIHGTVSLVRDWVSGRKACMRFVNLRYGETGLGMFGTLAPHLYPLEPLTQAKILRMPTTSICRRCWILG